MEQVMSWAVKNGRDVDSKQRLLYEHCPKSWKPWGKCREWHLVAALLTYRVCEDKYGE